MSKLQSIVSLSTTEAEYVAASEAGKELLWLKAFLQKLRVSFVSYPLYSDSQSAIHLAESDSFHARTKHIDIKYHAIRLWLAIREFELVKIHTDCNPADMLMKVVTLEKLRLGIASIGLR